MPDVVQFLNSLNATCTFSLSPNELEQLHRIHRQNLVRLFSVSANIGAGKSTVLERVSKFHTYILTIPEPVALFIDFNGKNRLQMFYEGQISVSQFQRFIMRCLRYVHSKALLYAWEHKYNVVLTERSCLDSYYIFGKDLIDNSEHAMWVQQEVWDSHPWCLPEQLIYLQTQPQCCLERMYQRNRGEESSVSLDYLTTLHNTHEDFFRPSSRSSHTLSIEGLTKEKVYGVMWECLEQLCQ